MYEEAIARATISVEQAYSLLCSKFLNLTQGDVRFIYHGSHNVFMVKNRYIFRFPDSVFGNKAFSLLVKENEILELIRSRILLQIPKNTYMSLNTQPPFVGYERISGQPLSKCFSHIAQKQKNEIAKQLGNFLSRLHSKEIYNKIAEQKFAEFSPAIYKQEWSNFYLAVQQKVFDKLTNEQQNWVTNLFTKFLNDQQNFCFAPRLTHGDFDTSNILVDSSSGFCVTGIIDFEDANVYDPAVDFLFFEEGLEFIDQILSHYDGPIDPRFYQRMYFQWNRIPLTYILDGIAFSNTNLTNLGFEMLEKRMKEFAIKHQFVKPVFIKGLKLCEFFYEMAVRPILSSTFSDLIYSAARIDSGSDVLGFDTPQSRDHDWGPKCMLFVRESDYEIFHSEICHTLGERLPLTIAGYPTNFSTHIDTTFFMKHSDTRPINHLVVITTVLKFFDEYIGINPDLLDDPKVWLALASQKLRTIQSGKIFHDGLNQLKKIKEELSWYPHDVWLYLLSNQWRRIDQEEPFIGRCSDVGDELGSRIIATRQVDNLMRLCFLMEKQYIPYYKWFGIAFANLNCAEQLLPIFHAILDASEMKTRESLLSQAYIACIKMHNHLNITPPIEPKVTTFWARPYLVPHSGRFVEAIQSAIQSEQVKLWPPYIGAVWQFSDSSDILSSSQYCNTVITTFNPK